MRFKKVHILLVLLFACSTGMAQMDNSFTFSVVGASNAIVSQAGAPFIADANGKCINVATGISALMVAGNGRGMFGEACKEKPPVVEMKVSLSVYPNPTRGQSILKCEGEFDLGLSCMVRILSIDGKEMMSKMVPMSQVQAGFMIDASAYASATYVVVVELAGKRYSLRLIKL